MSNPQRRRIFALTLVATLAFAAAVVPVQAQPDHAQDRRPDDRPGPHDDDAEDRANRSAHPDRNGTHPPGIDRACDNLNETQCERLRNATAHVAARRAAHHAHEAAEAVKDRVFRLEVMEFRARQALDQGNLSANETAELEAKIDRIQAAQDKLLERAAHLHDRVTDLRERYDAVRDHIDDRERVLICHAGEDGNKTLRLPMAAARAHLERHDDHRGACDDETHRDEQPEADHAQETDETDETDDSDGSESEETSTGSSTQTSSETDTSTSEDASDESDEEDDDGS